MNIAVIDNTLTLIFTSADIDKMNDDRVFKMAVQNIIDTLRIYGIKQVMFITSYRLSSIPHQIRESLGANGPLAKAAYVWGIPT